MLGLIYYKALNFFDDCMMKMKTLSMFSLIAAFTSTLLVACGGGSSSSNNSGDGSLKVFPIPDGAIEHLGAGEATVAVQNVFAFSESSRNLTDADRVIAFEEGNHFFENPWVQGSQSTNNRDGLGPYFNSNACQNCHVNDGRGHAANVEVDGLTQGHDFATMLIRVSLANVSESDSAEMAAGQKANVADSKVGGQLQHLSVDNVLNEAEQAVSYREKIITFEDGFEVSLREPIWHLSSNFGEFDESVVFSARVAPPMIGLGLLELIDEEDIINQADPDDLNADGISGKVNRVWSPRNNEVALGRFGWKSGQASLLEQTAGAFAGDMGLTSRFHPEDDCTSGRQDCLDAPNGLTTREGEDDDPFEVIDSTLTLVSFYSHHLAVPRRRNAYNPEIQAGQQIFIDAGCESCHTQQYTTGSNGKFPELSEQVIFPYTDMLLHDMGEALADFDVENNPIDADVVVEFQATAREWRTPPLWGLGMTHEVDADATFLHDGRARNILEAVLWHSGEAEASKQAVLEMDEAQRKQLLYFLNDL